MKRKRTLVAAIGLMEADETFEKQINNELLR